MTIWLTIDELARYLKRGRSTLYRMARNNHLPAHRIGSTWRFDREEVDVWIKSKKASPSFSASRGAGHAGEGQER